MGVDGYQSEAEARGQDSGLWGLEFAMRSRDGPGIVRRMDGFVMKRRKGRRLSSA